jgi:hypothetical protein
VLADSYELPLSDVIAILEFVGKADRTVSPQGVQVVSRTNEMTPAQQRIVNASTRRPFAFRLDAEQMAEWLKAANGM